ncbi:MAG: hypothetical protein U5N58_12255 [Actinomycetota bacterium]|nr:hypothetical protein [Actinomycetota bacterium]
MKEITALVDQLWSPNYELGQTYEDFLAREGQKLGEKYNLNPEEMEIAYIEIKYKHYIDRQKKNINMVANSLNFEIPDKIDYERINNISNEARKSLKRRCLQA